MNRTLCSIPLLLLSLSTASYAADQLIPAGSIVTCSVSEGRISSKTTAIGDPVLCTLNPVEKYGRSVLPYGSYMEGRFEDYKDPGHFVGKGWMQLTFDRMIIGNRVIPVSAKVVQVPKYKVDQNGRILGKGHPVRDTIEWLIPVLWPIDLINLPRRGPSPVLKPETKLTLEFMDDLGIPDCAAAVSAAAAGGADRARAAATAAAGAGGVSEFPELSASAATAAAGGLPAAILCAANRSSASGDLSVSSSAASVCLPVLWAGILGRLHAEFRFVDGCQYKKRNALGHSAFYCSLSGVHQVNFAEIRQETGGGSSRRRLSLTGFAAKLLHRKRSVPTR